jgi:hypothetical protein
MRIEIESGVDHTQAYGCRFCLHIGQTAIYFGQMAGGRGPILQIMTPFRWLRWCRGHYDAQQAEKEKAALAAAGVAWKEVR